MFITFIVLIYFQSLSLDLNKKFQKHIKILDKLKKNT